MSSDAELRAHIVHAVEHLDHVLPGQAPILNFVHHNTLHGYQHLDFEDALAAAEAVTGIRGYLPDSEYRRFYAKGRIDDRDIAHAFEQRPILRGQDVAASLNGRAVPRAEIMRVGLLYGIEPLPAHHLTWLIEEQRVLVRFQEDVSSTSRERFLAAQKQSEADAIESLWRACLGAFGLDAQTLHPEDLLDLPIDVAETLLARFAARKADTNNDAHHHLQAATQQTVAGVFAELGERLTLRSLLKAFTGRDVWEHVRPLLIRLCAAHLDEGVASWHAPDRAAGLLATWRRLAAYDAGFVLNDVPGWRDLLASLPEDPVDVVIMQLRALGLPDRRWEGYLRQLALELPGWSGIINWRQQRPTYAANANVPVHLLDYLAVRLCLDRLWAERICRETWNLSCSIPSLERYLSARLSEAGVRYHLYVTGLPEYLAERARALAESPLSRAAKPEAWRQVADMIFTWQYSHDCDRSGQHTVSGSVWCLFRLAQHLALPADVIRNAALADLLDLLTPLQELTPAVRGALWTMAYEHHYQDELINALACNHDRGRWANRDQRPEAQVVFCIDDREEGFRRHLEEHNPRIETLGAAGFFGVVINWRGLDDQDVTPLCPIVAVPAHEVREVPRAGTEQQQAKHQHGISRLQRLRSLYQFVRRNIVSAHAIIDILAPGVMLNLIGKVCFPHQQHHWAAQLLSSLVPDVVTEVAVSAPDDGTPATPEHPRLGFTDTEQADRVTALLRNIGLTSGFAPLVVLMAHGSGSQNNPHIAAYDCGACSGRHGGPNSRSFAAMANRPVVRKLLRERGIDVPEDTWFIGAEHNTCDERILWFDRQDVGKTWHAALEKLERELQHASAMSAHERCRRLASAPRSPTPWQALRHVVGRSLDFSQARPELGHATNAAAIVGRRSVSQGVFLDRRSFLISYDPTIDPDGKILEGILLAVGPVGAGINLEYYFSTVNNERYGCGTKVPHNVTGLFAVMEGASSDLRTGLPRQMVEVHEAIRLQIVVEAKPSILAAIYERQAPLRELIGNRWVYVIAKDPDTGAFSVFYPDKGFVEWAGPVREIPQCATSPEWYRGHTEPLGPALIRSLRKAAHA